MKGFLHVDHPLIAAAPEPQLQIFFFQMELPVHQNIGKIQNLFCNFPGAQLACQNILFKIVTGVAPDGFVRIEFLEFFHHTQHVRLVFRFKGFAAQNGKSFDKIVVASPQQFVQHFPGKGFSVIEIPGFRIEATPAVMTAAADEQRHPDTGAVSDIVAF